MPRDGSGVYAPPAGTTATSGTSIESAKYNAFISDLTSDANNARPIVAGGTGATTASAARTALGAQASSAALTSIAALSTAADKGIYTTASNTYATFDLTAAGRALLDDADAATQRTTLGLAIGTNVQAYNANLASLAGITLAQGDIIYATGTNTFARLAKGTAGQTLTMNAGETAPEWAGSPIKAYANFNSISASGTYSRTGNTVTVTLTGHGMTTGQSVYLDFTSGTATDGYYSVTVSDANTFTVTDAASGATSGNVTRTIWTRKSSGVSSIVRNGTGDYTVTLSPAMADTNYVVIGSARWDQNNAAASGFGFGASDAKTTSTFQCRSTQTNTASNHNSAEVNFMVMA